MIKLEAGCPDGKNENYYNKADIVIKGQYRFSFLFNCDKGGRRKVFELGYILIAGINAIITIGVALHSKIWSIRFNKRPISIELKWTRFLFLIAIIGALATAIIVCSA